jgi:hypothetical protein
MRKVISFLSTLGLVLSSLITLKASELDGLWRSDRQNITIRIEESSDGIRAKRIDQGIWYKYIEHERDYFVDRTGNSYEVITSDEIIWREANSTKRLSFRKVSARNNNNWNEDRYYDERRNWQSHQLVDIEGRWVDRFSGQVIDIRPFHDGYMLKGHRGGYEKYYPDRNGIIFHDRHGNTLQILDNSSIRWRDARGRDQRTFTRQSLSHQHGKPWR